ncbi:MAG: hypothetical protein ABI294_06795, partial [Casimicrobiaceae bacterium]
MPELTELRRPYPACEVRVYPVSARFDNPKNDDAGLSDLIDGARPELCMSLSVDEMDVSTPCR